MFGLRQLQKEHLLLLQKRPRVPRIPGGVTYEWSRYAWPAPRPAAKDGVHEKVMTAMTAARTCDSQPRGNRGHKREAWVNLGRRTLKTSAAAMQSLPLWKCQRT